MSLAPSAVATLLSTRLILEHYDRAALNTFVVAFSTMVLIPLNGLGAGTAVVSTFAESGSDSPESQRVLLTASRVMSLSSLVLALGALSISVAEFWPELLGDGVEPGFTFGLGLAIYAATFVPGLGQSVLLGVNKNHLSILVQSFLAPAMCVGVVLCIAFDASTSTLVLVPALSVALLAWVNAVVSSRVTQVRWLPILARLPRVRRFPGGTIRHLAGPALVVNITGPLALQSDRLVISHRSTEVDLTNYSITVQLFAPLLAVVLAAAQPIWPAFSKARAEGTKPPSMLKIMLLFGGVAGAAGAVIVVLAGPFGRLIGGEGTDLGTALPVLMAVLVVSQAVGIPLGMALRDREGLRLLARLNVIALPVNIGLSIALAPQLGATGPLLATVLVGYPIQFAPLLVHFRRRQMHGPTVVTEAGPSPEESVPAAP